MDSAVVGSLVTLAEDFASYSDASGGPLALGQTGVVVEVGGTLLRVKRQSGEGSQWW